MNDSRSEISDLARAELLDAIEVTLREAFCCEKEEQLAATYLALVRKLTGSRSAFIGELDREGRIAPLAVSDPGGDGLDTGNAIDCSLLESAEALGLAERVAANGRPMTLDRRATGSAPAPGPGERPEPDSLLGVPLKRDGEPFGVLVVANRPEGYGRADGEKLELLSVAIAQGLTGYRAQRRLREAYDQLQSKVEEQTAELFTTEERLQLEAAERLRAERALSESEQLRGSFIEMVLTTQDEERSRLARELHDEMGAKLTSISIGLRSLDQVDSVQAARTELGKVQQLVEGMMLDVSRLARGLYPMSLEQLGLHAALRQYVDEFSRIHPLKVHIHAENLDAELPRTAATAIFRVVQEALTNVARHADARNVSVVLGKKDSEIRVFIEDDGKGLPEAAVRPDRKRVTGVGLHGIRERATLLGGTLEIESRPGEGTALLVRIPAPRGHNG